MYSRALTARYIDAPAYWGICAGPLLEMGTHKEIQLLV